MQLIEKYFPNLTEKQKEQFQKMLQLYPEWNEKINVVSRKDIENLEERHILHSLAIAKFTDFKPGTTVLDLGTGGGFPAIPLAVLFPDVHFHLIDRIGKKINVAREVAQAIGLENVSFQHGDAGECHDKFDFVVSRAVMPLGDLMKLIRRNVSPKQKNSIANGLITLKGGDLSAELRALGKNGMVESLTRYFDEPFFETKKIIYSPIQ